jgi:hypothetical protein
MILQWDHCLSTLLIRSTLGASFGVIFSVLLFKRRSWPVFTGLGFGAGRAWEECDSVSLTILLEGSRRGLVNSHEADVSEDAFENLRPCVATIPR